MNLPEKYKQNENGVFFIITNFKMRALSSMITKLFDLTNYLPVVIKGSDSLIL